MNKQKKIFHLTSISFAFLMAIMFSFAVSTTSEAASLGKVTNVTQTFGGLDNYTYYIDITFNPLAGADAYAVQISTDKVNWEFAEDSALTDKPYFSIGDKTTLKAGSTYYIKVIPVYAFTYEGQTVYDYYEEDISNASVVQVVTAPAKLTTVTQTAATTSSMTAKWSAVPGATGYIVYTKKYGDTSYTYNGTTSSLYYNIKKCEAGNLTPSSAYYVVVCPIRKSSTGFIAEADANGYLFRTTTKKVSSISGFWKINSKDLSVSWTNDAAADGYELEFYNSKGKKIKTVDVGASYSGTRTYTFNKAPKNSTCSVKIRSYIKLDNNVKAYSEWSKKSYFISQANMPAKKYDLNKGKLTLKWSKVTGAKKYVIYAGTSSNKMKKVATVSSKKTSYTLKKIGGSKISSSKTYYIKVVPQTKLGGKTIKGDHGYYWRISRFFF